MYAKCYFEEKKFVVYINENIHKLVNNDNKRTVAINNDIILRRTLPTGNIMFCLSYTMSDRLE